MGRKGGRKREGEPRRKQQSRQQPPLNWFALLSGDDRSDWMTLHRFHALDRWKRARGITCKLRLVAASLAWPMTAAILALHQCGKAGAFVRCRTGKSRSRQYLEQIHLAVVECISPKSYYMFQLYDPANRAKAQRYLHRYETKYPAGLYPAISRNARQASRMLCDKAAFHDRCVERGLRTPKIYLTLRDGAVSAELCAAILPARDLFIKPRIGRGGTGTQAWNYTQLGDYRNMEGERLERAQLFEKLRSDSEGRALLVQERIQNHPDLAVFCGSALSTARIMTVINEAEAPEPVAAVFRMAVSNTIVDNIHRGGIAASVELKTGELGSAIALGPKAMRMNVHPSSRRRFRGRSLPHWDAALAPVVRAHESFPGRATVGWDVAFTRDGPVLIEGNSSPCVHLLQRGMGEPLGGTRFAQLLAYHLRTRAGFR